jgi:hypothetical protein
MYFFRKKRGLKNKGRQAMQKREKILRKKPAPTVAGWGLRKENRITI